MIYHVALGLNAKNHEVLTGLVDGIPTQLDYRWLTLFHINIPITLFVAALALLMGFLLRAMAQGIEGSAQSEVVNACAWYFFVAGTLFLTQGPLSFWQVGSVLRREKRKG
jgi:hypothetical protein